ncbi:ABC-type dipeptide/oligopeptide/nickel transport system, permease component [Desulfosporosinus orientis DSM 765]|uniref:ABC-type dipeptide/oligopeptide/nickel transport system, permease component n=1 Tax=Desulfosporosinus orientis (strain ATCC 19365 / DSM 765 / NCIMB 8382 / VKM B-1628 / Singapore I) TaxID=768706 RepID=G7WFI7_DESOD|nr:ABC transporter permease [Desulfosporosinus orientis]AET68430.1 ABC-type dipeptide/oligopeptide/nickel transport system, permease component [Desulfosporosinus orientis DSM 765]
MIRYILKRLATVLLVLWLVATTVYFTMHVTPGDTANAIIVEVYGEEAVSEETLAKVRHSFGLNRTVSAQYGEWLKNVFQGELGTSYKYNLPVSYMLKVRLPNTLLLGFTAFLISVLVAIPLGIVSALCHNRWLDHLSRLFTLLLSSFPSFWIALLLIIAFSIHLKLLPVSGMSGPESIVLPALTLSMGMTAATTRMMRSSMLDVIGQDYIAVARGKGLKPGEIINRHVLRNAFPPIITVMGLQIGHILGGAVVIENIFSWPGIGGLFIDSINAKDLPMMEGCVLILALGYALINLTVDMIYVGIDPRIKYSGGDNQS